MRRFGLAVAALAIIPLLSVSSPSPGHAKDGVGVAIIGGLIAGAAIGAAVAASKKHPQKVYVKPPPPPKAKPFSPHGGVKCYPKQHACYNKNGSYNGKWTWKIYAK
ncbi:MAG: hypothetical protein GY798_34495 [Hyphomicrobiales bacterium]|nr:hypothetical protein [Hyphomicrobiales bacterium]